MTVSTSPVLSILIKALNEERHIAACLQAAVAEARSVGGDVILVDSLSEDRTVEIASKFPVRIVQFASRDDRSCAAAVQLGFQYSTASMVYVLDADMVLEPGFLTAAIRRLESDPRVAGVGGVVHDAAIRTQSDRRRQLAASRANDEQPVDELSGGGLYRVRAVKEVGYLAHRGLAAFEEAELGSRLRCAGWQLVKLPHRSVSHCGHEESNWGMLRRLWRSGRAQATGAVLRAAFGRPWFWLLARKLRFVVAVPTMWIGSALLAFIGGGKVGGAALAFGHILLLGALVARHRSVADAAWKLVFFYYFSLSAIVGFARAPRSPFEPVRGHEL